MTLFAMLDPRADPEMLGLLPGFLNEDDPRSAREQIDSRQPGGWFPTNGFKMKDGYVLTHPGDPPLKPLAVTLLHDEIVLVYRHAWVCIVQPDESYEVARCD